MDTSYTISRRAILTALRLPVRIPVGEEGSWSDVTVATGRRGDGPELTLPAVRLEGRGVANRIRVRCPLCRRWYRFCALQQHTGTPPCRANRGKE